MNKHVCIVLQNIWRRNSLSRLGLSQSCKCFSSIVPEKSKSIKSPIKTFEISKDKKQLSSKKPSKLFTLYTLLWRRLLNPLFYIFTPGIKKADQLRKLNDFRTFTAFGAREGDAVRKTSQRCFESPKPINVKKKFEIDDCAIKDTYQVIKIGKTSKIYSKEKIKHSRTIKFEVLPKVGYKSMLYNIILRNIVDSKIEKMMPNINHGQLSYLSDLRTHRVNKDIAYVQEKIEPVAHEMKEGLKKSTSQLNKGTVEMGKENIQRSTNLNPSHDIIGVNHKKSGENVNNRFEEKKDNFNIKRSTLKPPQHTKSGQNIIKHALNIKPSLPKGVKTIPVNVKGDSLKSLNKINSAPFEHIKLSNKENTLGDGKLKDKLMPSSKLNVVETNQLSAITEDLKKTDIMDKVLKGSALKTESSIVENKNVNFTQLETKTKPFQSVKESTKVTNDSCLTVAINKGCNSELRDESKSLGETNERLSPLECVRELITEENSNKDGDTIVDNAVSSQKSDNINEVKQQINEATLDEDANLDFKIKESDSGKEISNAEDGEHKTTSGDESEGTETEQEHVSLKCQPAEDEEIRETVSSSVEKAHPVEYLSTELVSIDTAGEEGVLKTQKQNTGSDTKGKLVDMNTVLIKESRENLRKNDKEVPKSNDKGSIQNHSKNFDSLETVTPKMTGDLNKSSVKPLKIIKETEHNVTSLNHQIKDGSGGTKVSKISKKYITNKSAGKSSEKGTGSKLQPIKSALKINANKIKAPRKTSSLEGMEANTKQIDKTRTKTSNPVPDLIDLENNNNIANTKTKLDVQKTQNITTVKDNKHIKAKQSKRASNLKTTQSYSVKNEEQPLKINKSTDDLEPKIGIKDNKNNEKMSIKKIKKERIVVKKPLEKYVEEVNSIQPKNKAQKDNSVKKTKSLTRLSKSAMSINSTSTKEETKNAKDDILVKQEQNSDKVINKIKINNVIRKSKSANDRLNISKSSDVSSNHELKKNTTSKLKPNTDIKGEIEGSTEKMLLKKVNLKQEKMENREISQIHLQNIVNKGNKPTKSYNLKSVTNNIFNDTSKDNKGIKENSSLDKKATENVVAGQNNKMQINTNTHNSLKPKRILSENATNQKKNAIENVNEYQKSVKTRNIAMISPINKNAETLTQKDNNTQIETVSNAQKFEENVHKQFNRSKKLFIQNNKSSTLNTLKRRNNSERLEDS